MVRPCIVDGKKALFHKWIEQKWVVPPSPFIGGEPGGQISQNYALVEYEDGKCAFVNPLNVKFLDYSFKKYCFVGGYYENQRKSKS